jgi:hypothetical protein
MGSNCGWEFEFPRLEQGFGVSGKLPYPRLKLPAGFLRLAAIVFFFVTIKKIGHRKNSRLPVRLRTQKNRVSRA